jgi:dehydrogenase/reductase SDR family member 7B
MEFRNKICWITGASSGIGEELALLLAKEGAKLLLSGSNLELLKKVSTECLKHTSFCVAIPFDLSNPAEVEKVATETVAQHGPIFLLVNNGGISQRALAIETPLSIDRRIMEIDYFSHVAITKIVAKGMILAGEGFIAVTSSVAGKFGFHQRSAYSAAKHALQGFFETLRLELLPHGVFVTTIYPGYINTPISIRAIDADGKPHGVMDKGQLNGMSAKTCAKRYLMAIKNKRPEAIIAGKEKILLNLKRLSPWLFFKLVKRIKQPV